MTTTHSSRINTDRAHRFPWYARLFFANQRRRYGKELKPAHLWARTPRVFAALSLPYAALDRSSSPIEPAHRSLLTVRVLRWHQLGDRHETRRRRRADHGTRSF